MSSERGLRASPRERWYLKGYRDPHRCLLAFRVLNRSTSPFAVLRVPMHVPRGLAKGPNLLHRLLAGVFKFVGHLDLPLRIMARPNGLVIVREFLTVPLLVVLPFLLPMRERVFLMIHHNLDGALRRPWERWILTLARSLGLRFVMLERGEGLSEVLGRSGFQQPTPTLPFPTVNAPLKRPVAASRLTIGFVGAPRSEKQTEWVMPAVIAWAKARGEVDLLIGRPGTVDSTREDQGVVVHHVDTSSEQAYLAALARCSVVLPYSTEAYRYRASGVVADAISNGCVVVTPQLPLIAHQISWPLECGKQYSCEDDFASALNAAVELFRLTPPAERAQRYRDARSGSGLLEAALAALTVSAGQRLGCKGENA